MRFTALLHHITPQLLRMSYFSLKREAATGVDGQTWRQYGEKLEMQLNDLHERIQNGPLPRETVEANLDSKE